MNDSKKCVFGSTYIIVPCFNEELNIKSFYQTVRDSVKDADCYLKSGFKFIFIDDGSKDNSLEVMRSLHGLDSSVHYVSFSRNFGKESGLLAGIRKALSLSDSDDDLFVVMDVDLQDPPSLLQQMLEILYSDTNIDIVATYREDRIGESRFRSFFAHCFYKFINKISEVEMKDGARDFRLMRKKVVEAISELGETQRFSKGIFMWVGFNTTWLAYHNVQRIYGSSKWHFTSLLKYAFEGIIAFTVVPLEVISGIGLIVFLLSIIAFLFLFIRALVFGDPVSGWPSLACLITLLSGVQLLSLGVIGLYLSKAYLEVKRRPAYFVSEEA